MQEAVNKTQNAPCILQGLGEQVNCEFANCPEAVKVYFLKESTQM
jgi:hypothetical protein